jgi:type I restriction enzyme, S subunit
LVVTDSLRSGWNLIRLEELAGLRVEKIVPRPDDQRPYVGLEHIAQGRPKLLGRGRAGEVISHKTVFRAGDILYGKLRRALRKVVRVDFDGVCSTDILAIYPKRPEDGAYLQHLLHSDGVLAHALQSAKGTKMPRTSWDDLRSYALMCPPPSKREVSGTMLTAMDEAMERADSVIAASEQLRDLILSELLSRGLPGWHVEWKHAPRFGAIPACWQVLSLSDVAEVQSGRAIGRTNGIAGLMTLPYLTVANIKDGYVDLSNVKTMQVSTAEADRFSLRRGDVLFTEGGDADKLGRGCIWDGQLEPCLHQNHIFAVRPDPTLLVPEFLAAYASSVRGKAYFLSCAKQTTNLASINSTQLRSMPLLLPSIIEQEQIVSILVSLGTRLGAERRVLESLARTKSIISRELLS